MTSVPTSSPSTVTAVRQTPLTATESPAETSAASVVESVRRTPSSVASTAATVPRSATRPVNIAFGRGDSRGSCRIYRYMSGKLDKTAEVATTRAGAPRSAGRRRRARSRASARASASEMRSTPSPSSGSRAARPPSSSGARNSRTSSISPASRNAPASFGPPSSRIDVTPDEPSWSSAERTRAGSFSPTATTTSAPESSSASVVRAPRRTRHDDGQRQRGRRSDELRVQRQPRRRVEDDVARLVVDAVDARRQRRVVGQRRPDPDRDRVDRSPPAVRPRPRRLVGDPLRVAGARRDLAVERHRRLEQHPRPPRARVLAKGLVDEPRAPRDLAVGDLDRDALVAQDPQPAARRPSRSGRRSRRRRARCRPRGSRRCTAASCPDGSTAPSRRRASRPRATAPAAFAIALTSACGPPCSSCQPSPRTVPSRTSSAPTIGFGCTRPSPNSASSIARSRWSWSAAVSRDTDRLYDSVSWRAAQGRAQRPPCRR